MIYFVRLFNNGRLIGDDMHLDVTYPEMVQRCHEAIRRVSLERYGPDMPFRPRIQILKEIDWE